MYVPFTYVNDGVCDYELCCDGSEEYQQVNSVKCENRCAQIGKDYRRLEEEKRTKMERAGKQRKVMARQAAELRAGVEARLTELVGEVARLEAKRDGLQKAHAQIASDGLLLYLAQASYEPGTSPLSTWVPLRAYQTREEQNNGLSPAESPLDVFDR